LINAVVTIWPTARFRAKKELKMARLTVYGMGLVWALVLISGCGSNGSSTADKPSGDDSIDRNASLRQSVELVGIWLGRSLLDRPALNAHLESISDAAERSRIEEMARAFESVSIAMEFRSDSTMEIEIEIMPAHGAPIRESTLGTWQVVSCDATSISVRCSENLEDGRVEEQTLKYEISADKNVLTTEAPVSDELRQFHPRFEFERRVETKIAEQPSVERTIFR
jgi:hypothetical protein